MAHLGLWRPPQAGLSGADRGESIADHSWASITALTSAAGSWSPSSPLLRRCQALHERGRSALVQSGLLSGDERREAVEGGGPPGLSVVAAGGVGPVAERHPRLGAVVVEFHARDRGLVHSHLWHRVGA
jgi:hypothetical protein